MPNTPNLNLPLPPIGPDSYTFAGLYMGTIAEALGGVDNVFPGGKLSSTMLPNPIDAGTF